MQRSVLTGLAAMVLVGAWQAGSSAQAQTAIGVSPYPITAGMQVEVTYNPAGRVLETAPLVYAHVGFNDWNPVIAPDPAMTWDVSNGIWKINIDIPQDAYQLDLVFNDGSGTWDNNNGADWHLFVLGGSGAQWTIDGTLDENALLVAENGGNQLYAGVRGSTLYVAAPRATAGNDHFIFVTDSPGSPAAAPWDKSGTVAAWSAYVGNEVDNGWSGWFNASGAADVTAAGWLEATLDLAGEFGSVPSDIYLAFAPYPTNEAGSLVHTGQVPASTDADGNIEASEYLQVSVAAIAIGCTPLDLDADCDVDNDDYAVLAGCLLGPGFGSCAKADLDDDGDVDLADYAAYQVAVSGPPAGAGVAAEDLGVGVTRFYPDDVQLTELPPSMSLAVTPTVHGTAPQPWTVDPYFFESGGRHVVLIPTEAGTSLYGTGEVCGGLLRNGHTTEAWNTDAYGYGPWRPSLYQSHPWVLAVRPDGSAYGVLADTTFRCRMDLTFDIVFAAEGPEFPIYVFEGDSPQAVLTRLTDFIGRIEMPPLWTLGYQQSRYSYAPASYAQSVAAEFRARDIPCDVIWFDIDYMDGFRIFTFDPVGFANPSAVNAGLQADGFHTVWMIDPGAKAEVGYFVDDEGSADDHWVYNAEGGSWYTGEVWPGQSHFPDFTRPETRTWWAGLYQDFMAEGVDGVWNDLNEPGIFDGPGHSMPITCWHRGGGGLPAGLHQQYHNVYGMLMSKASHEGIKAANPTKRPFVLSRASFIGGHRYAAMWTGDNVATWDHLYWSTPMVLNMGLSGQPFAGPDLGGFVDDGTPDLFSRWMGVGVFMPFCRTHCDNQGLSKEPWAYGAAAEAVAKTSIERRYRLLPYLYTLMREASLTGLPVLRPVFFADPADLSLRSEDVAFLVGADVLVVPNVSQSPGAALPALPSGTWRTISLVGEDSTADVNLPDVRVRGGAIVPLGPVMEYTQEVALDPLTLVVSLDGAGTASGYIYEDAGDGYGYLYDDYRYAHYVATQSGNTVSVEVQSVEGTMSLLPRQVVVEVVTDSGVYSATGADANSGVIATVNLP